MDFTISGDRPLTEREQTQRLEWEKAAAAAHPWTARIGSCPDCGETFFAGPGRRAFAFEQAARLSTWVSPREGI